MAACRPSGQMNRDWRTGRDCGKATSTPLGKSGGPPVLEHVTDPLALDLNYPAGSGRIFYRVYPVEAVHPSTSRVRWADQTHPHPSQLIG